MFADLHIHSCLSPCGHEWMTPGNIAGMAKIKELDAIAIADHNCAKNLRAADAVCRAYGVVLVPAMEITTREEAHLLGYFETVEQAEGMSDWLYERLPDIMNVPEIFGAQQILNEDDVEIGTVDKLLLSAVDASIEELVEEIHRRGGRGRARAHQPRLQWRARRAGFLPVAPFDALEVGSLPPLSHGSFRLARDALLRCAPARDISERDFYLHTEEISARAVLHWLKGNSEAGAHFPPFSRDFT